MIAKLIEEYQENENFAPKQDKRDCPLTFYFKAKSFNIKKAK